MRFFLCLFLLLPLSAFALNDCMNGKWIFDEDESDNAETLLNKLKNKQKQQQRVLNRVGDRYNDDEEDLSLPASIPAFVFSQENLVITMNSTRVSLVQPDLERIIPTDGTTQSKSLKALQLQGDTTLASWENDALIVETTTVGASKVEEIISLADANTLQMTIRILTPLQQIYTLEKSYRRQDEIKACDINKN